MATQVELLTGLVNVAIPEVYQKGMSYYEVLTAVVNKVNELIERSNEYFGTPALDVIRSILINWVDDGTLASLISDAVLKIGNRTFTEQNFITNLESVTASLDSLDMGVKSRFDELMINVKDFGAVLDGVTDDTVAMQTAVDSFPANGGTLYIPAGTMLLTSSIIFPINYINGGFTYLKKIAVVGDSASVIRGNNTDNSINKTTILYTGAGAMFDLRCGTGANTYFWGVFRNFSAYGSETPGQIGIRAYHFTSGIIKDIQLGWFDNGLQVDGYFFYNTVDGLLCNNNLNNGAKFASAINGTKFNRCKFNLNTVNGVLVQYGGVDVNFDSCWFELNGVYGVRVENTYQVNLRGCYFEDNVTAGVFVLGSNVANVSVLNDFGSYYKTIGDCGININNYVLVNIFGSMTLSTADVSFIRDKSAGNTFVVNAVGYKTIVANPATDYDVPLASAPRIASDIGHNGASSLLAYHGMTTQGKILALGGLGVGNSTPATTLGTVVKKMQVFDMAGNSVGFVPVYDAIT